MSRVYSKKKRACRWNDTPGPPYTMLRLHIYFSAPHLIIPHYSQMSRGPGNFPSESARPGTRAARVPGNLIWGFVLCFLAVGVLGVYKNHARVGCQLRIRGGRGACYRKVRPLAHPDLIVIYFHPINLLPLLIFHSAHSGFLRLSTKQNILSSGLLLA
jgi:hypothetical protein